MGDAILVPCLSFVSVRVLWVSISIFLARDAIYRVFTRFFFSEVFRCLDDVDMFMGDEKVGLVEVFVAIASGLEELCEFA